MKYKHYYACPYCELDVKKGHYLRIIKDLSVSCEHKKGFWDKDKECRKEDFLCKEVLECNICDATFKLDKDFLNMQRRVDEVEDD
jgi:hypothetical protein